MPAQLRPIGTIAFASLLASGIGVSVPAKIAFALDCLTAPNSASPPNSHWYYRTDRAQDRKCWHLQTDSGPAEQGAVQAVREAPAKPSQSVAGGPGFKESVTQHAGVKLSDQDVEKLYAEFGMETARQKLGSRRRDFLSRKTRRGAKFVLAERHLNFAGQAFAGVIDIDRLEG